MFKNRKRVITGLVILVTVLSLLAQLTTTAFAWHGTTTPSSGCYNWNVSVNTTWTDKDGTAYEGYIVESSNLSGSWAEGQQSVNWSITVGWDIIDRDGNPAVETWKDNGTINFPEYCVTPTPTNTPTPTSSPTPSPSPSPSPTPTDVPTETPTSTPTSSPSPTPTNTPVPQEPWYAADASCTSRSVGAKLGTSIVNFTVDSENDFSETVEVTAGEEAMSAANVWQEGVPQGSTLITWSGTFTDQEGNETTISGRFVDVCGNPTITPTPTQTPPPSQTPEPTPTAVPATATPAPQGGICLAEALVSDGTVFEPQEDMGSNPLFLHTFVNDQLASTDVTSRWEELRDANNLHPSLSPDNCRQVFTSDGTLWYIGPDGSAPNQWIDPYTNEPVRAEDPDWGSYFQAYSNMDQGGQIYLTTESGWTNEGLVISEGEPIIGSDMDWAPDGKTLVYVTPDFNIRYVELAYHSDGTFEVSRAWSSSLVGFAPRFSADGSEISYTQPNGRVETVTYRDDTIIEVEVAREISYDEMVESNKAVFLYGGQLWLTENHGEDTRLTGGDEWPVNVQTLFGTSDWGRLEKQPLEDVIKMDGEPMTIEAWRLANTPSRPAAFVATNPPFTVEEVTTEVVEEVPAETVTVLTDDELSTADAKELLAMFLELRGENEQLGEQILTLEEQLADAENRSKVEPLVLEDGTPVTSELLNELITLRDQQNNGVNLLSFVSTPPSEWTPRELLFGIFLIVENFLLLGILVVVLIKRNRKNAAKQQSSRPATTD